MILIVSLLFGCQHMNNTGDEQLFTRILPENSGVNFVNQLDYEEEFNIYRYRNFYNGGGVALGDINNDGLVDIYFTSNMHSNRLYLNKGGFVFEDITEKAKVGGSRAWSTGVSMVDINGDGWLDIYVCNSGDVRGDNKQNELFINQGDQTFTEEADQYGIADQGFSTHGAFFDYDKDGDLDLYLLNNSYQAIGSFDLKVNLRNERDSIGGDKLYRNDGNHFTDVSVEAGIYGSIIGFGLGVTVGDINMDGWPDIYVSNDFFERDYIYINNGDGTFSERLEDMMECISAASMGADMADINNDTRPEIFVTDMIPQPDYRIKTKTTFDSWDSYKFSVDNGYYNQFTRNMLHLNNGDGTFSEIGRFSGVFATDWSWGALIFDMDNDGLKDIFVANGIAKDLTDQDYIEYFSNVRVMRQIITGDNVDFKRLIDAIPSEKIPNYAFKNTGKLHFINKAKDWGLGLPSHSNGSAYGDLDNDGDLDLVVNNVNMPAFIFDNHSVEKLPGHHYLKFILKGSEKNTDAIGTKIIVITNGERRYLEQVPVRGFQSTVDHRPNMGLGTMEIADSVIVRWPDDRITLLTNVPVDTTLTLSQNEGKIVETPIDRRSESHETVLKDVTDADLLDFTHHENDFDDFTRESLIYQMLSTEGPRMARGDINADGRDDIYIGGAKESPGSLFVQQSDGSFRITNQEIFDADRISEDTDAAFFDADGDGDQDLYVTSGGNEFSSSSTALIDRLYMNDGRGNFSRSDQILPTNDFESTTAVKPADFDLDGDIDLFVGVRLKPLLYGVPCNGYLLQNDGNGNFTDISGSAAPGLKNIGMITDMQWADIDQDGDPDMVIVGDWMPVTIFVNDTGKFQKQKTAGLENSNGWWNCLESADIDHDGDIDFIAGNHGLNSRFKASLQKPVSMYVNDFDNNGTVEQILTVYNGEKAYPLALKHDLVRQIPSLKKKYPNYVDYARQTITDIFTPRQLESAITLHAFEMRSSVILNDGNGNFHILPLPERAQFSTIHAVLVKDLAGESSPDLLVGGNLYDVKPEVGRYDASYGLLLEGNGDGTFRSMPSDKSGVLIKGQIRDIQNIQTSAGDLYIVARNNDHVVVLKHQIRSDASQTVNAKP